MTITVEINFWNGLCFLLGALFLVASILEELRLTAISRFLSVTPLSLALAGAGCALAPVGSALAFQGTTMVGYVVSFLPWTLLLAAALLEKKARELSSHNKSLQLTVDPGGSLTDAKEPSASTAAEPRR